MASRLYDEKTSDYFSSARTEIAPLLPDNTSRILEVGCGAGSTIRWMRDIRRVQFACGIELNSQAAETARGFVDQVITADFQTCEVPLEPLSFDLILALDVLEHLVDPWDAVKRLHEFLKPGGYIIASIPNIAHYSAVMPLLAGRFEYEMDGILDRTHLRFFTESTAVELLSPPGLGVDLVDYIFTVPGKRLRWYIEKYRLNSAMKKLPFNRLLKKQLLIRAQSFLKEIPP